MCSPGIGVGQGWGVGMGVSAVAGDSVQIPVCLVIFMHGFCLLTNGKVIL